MSKPVEVYLANTTITPFTMVPPEADDQRGRVVLALHRGIKPIIRVTFDRDQWVEVLESLTAAINGRTHPTHYKPEIEGDTHPRKAPSRRVAERRRAVSDCHRRG